MITVSRPINDIGSNKDEYFLGEDGKPLRFASFNDALRYFARNNYTLREILWLDFNLEATREAK